MTASWWIKKAVFCLLLLLFPYISHAQSQQLSGTTAQTVINNARYYINESTASFWTDAELLVYLNAGILDVATMTKSMEGTEAQTLQTGVTQYSISSNYLTVENVVYSGATSTTRPSNFKSLQKVSIKEIGHSEDAGEPVRYYIWNDYIYIDPKPTSSVSGYSIILYLTERPTAITLTGSIPTPAAYDDALALYVSAKAALKDRNFSSYSGFYNLYLNMVRTQMERAGLTRAGQETK